MASVFDVAERELKAESVFDVAERELVSETKPTEEGLSRFGIAKEVAKVVLPEMIKRPARLLREEIPSEIAEKGFPKIATTIGALAEIVPLTGPEIATTAIGIPILGKGAQLIAKRFPRLAQFLTQRLGRRLPEPAPIPAEVPAPALPEEPAFLRRKLRLQPPPEPPARQFIGRKPELEQVISPKEREIAKISMARTEGRPIMLSDAEMEIAKRIQQVEFPITPRTEEVIPRGLFGKLPAPEKPILLKPSKLPAEIETGRLTSLPAKTIEGTTESIVPIETAVARKVTGVKKPLMTEAEAAKVESEIIAKLPEGDKGLRLSNNAVRGMVNAAEETIKQTGAKINPDIPVTAQVVRMITDNPSVWLTHRTNLIKNGVNPLDMGQGLMATESNAGRVMGIMGNFAKRWQSLSETVPEIRELASAIQASKPPLSSWDLTTHFWSRFVNIWRASLVTAWSTAVRNFETQAGRAGINSVEQLMNVSLNKVFRISSKNEKRVAELLSKESLLPKESWELNKLLEAESEFTPTFRKIYETFFGMLNKGNRKQVKEIIDNLPDVSERLFNRFSSDVAVTTKLEQGLVGRIPAGIESFFNKWERGINAFNFLNRGQEFLIRKSVFRAELSRSLEKIGLDISKVTPREIPEGLIESAINKALEITFAQNPKTGLGKAIMQIYENPLGKALSFIQPFPRFMMQAWKFNYEYSPAGFLKLLSKAERNAIANGNPAVINKALIGSGLLYGAKQVRDNPDLAGEKWYEIKRGKQTIDMRPFAPFSSYLFVAELMKRLGENRPLPEIKDLMQGLTSGSFRAGAGLYLLDQVSELATGLLSGDPNERATRAISSFAGEIGSGFLQPITTFRELFVDYGKFLGDSAGELAEEEAKLRETREMPFLGPGLKKLPIASQILPERETPFTEETPRLEPFRTEEVIPLPRQFTGIPARRKSPVETEFDKLGLKRAEVFPRTGEPKADRLINRQLGIISDRLIAPLIQSERYQKLDNETKRVVLNQVFSEARRETQKPQSPFFAFKGEEELFRKIILKRAIRPRIGELLESKGIEVTR